MSHIFEKHEVGLVILNILHSLDCHSFCVCRVIVSIQASGPEDANTQLPWQQGSSWKQQHFSHHRSFYLHWNVVKGKKKPYKIKNSTRITTFNNKNNNKYIFIQCFLVNTGYIPVYILTSQSTQCITPRVRPCSHSLLQLISQLQQGCEVITLKSFLFHFHWDHARL